MSYYEKLNAYMLKLNCTSKELAEQTGLSNSLISKYRTGSRTPKVNSENFYKVITGLKELSNKRGLTFDSDQVFQEFEQELNPYHLNYEICLGNFNRIIDILNINSSNLAKFMDLDSSFLYRVRTGNRKPFDITHFFEMFVRYLIFNYGQDKAYDLNELLELNTMLPQTPEQYHDLLFEYLNQNHTQASSFMDSFFESFVSFDINQFSMNYDDHLSRELTEFFCRSVPTHQKKFYTGGDGGKKAELDFLKAVLASSSREPVFLYNEVSMESEFTDPEFYQKWLYGLALLLKNGLKIHIIHNIYRPAKEMLIGLKSWLPLYMSGAVHSYYFTSKFQTDIKYLHCTSGDKALIGETMDGTDSILYYYTTKEPELSYYQAKSRYLMEHARPLMDFYYEDRDSIKFQEFLEQEHVYSLPWVEKPEFHNIEFRIKENEWIMISRMTEPKMHFVIYNPKIIHTIRTYLHYF